MHKASILIVLFLSISPLLFAQRSGKTDLFLRAVALYSEDNLAEAEKMLSALHDSNPEDDAVNYYLGLCRFGLGRPKEAEALFLDAARCDSTNTWYLNTLANYYRTAGDLHSAAEYCEKLIKASPNLYSDAASLCLIGDAKLAEYKDSLALSYYDKALAVDPDYIPAEMGRSEVFRIRRNYPAYFVSIDRFISSELIMPSAKSDYLKALLETIDGRFYRVWGEQISKLVDKCVTMHPEDIESHKLKMSICSINQDYPGIIAECEKIVEVALASGNREAMVEAKATIGDIWYEMGDMKKVYAAYDEVLEADPEYAPVLNNYAYFLCLEKKSLKKALKMSRTAIEKEPDNATYLDTYAWILFMLHRPKEAKPYLKHAMIYGGKESAVILGHYSRILDALGEKELSAYYKSLSEQKSK